MKIFERLLLLLGVGLFAALVWRIGLPGIAAQLARVRWGFLLILAAGAAPQALNTLAWRFTLGPEHRRVGYGTLLGFALAGDAINAVTPAAVVGGDFVRMTLLRRRVPTDAAIGSVTVAATVQFVAQVFFVAAGTPFVLREVVLLPVRRSFLSVVLLLAGSLLAVAYVFRRGDAFRRIRAALRRLGLLKAPPEGRPSRWERLDEEIFGAIRRRPADTAAAFGIYLLGWVSGAAEIAVILRLLGIPAGFTRVAAIEVLSVLIDALTFFVPARMGTQEGGKYLIFLALGLDPRGGFAVGLLRRLRELCFAFVGLLIYGRQQRPPDAAIRVPSVPSA